MEAVLRAKGHTGTLNKRQNAHWQLLWGLACEGRRKEKDGASIVGGGVVGAKAFADADFGRCEWRS